MLNFTYAPVPAQHGKGSGLVDHAWISFGASFHTGLEQRCEAKLPPRLRGRSGCILQPRLGLT
jgi:hypothetical protein